MLDFDVMIYDLVANILNIVMGAAIPLLVALGGNYLRKRFKLNISQQQEQALSEWATGAVKTISQTYNPAAGNKVLRQEKRDAAIKQLVGTAARGGVKITTAIAQDKVEEAVNTLKRLKQIGG